MSTNVVGPKKKYELGRAAQFVEDGNYAPLVKVYRRKVDGYVEDTGRRLVINTEEALKNARAMGLPPELLEELERHYRVYREALDERLKQEEAAQQVAREEEKKRLQATVAEKQAREAHYLEKCREIVGDPTYTPRHLLYAQFLCEVEEDDAWSRQHAPEDWERERQRFIRSIQEMYWEDKYKASTPRHLLRWYPRGLSQGGFLGWGEILEQVIVEDEATLHSLGRTAEEVGEKLLEILSQKPASHQVEVTSWLGQQLCPFPACPHGQCQKDNRPCLYADLDFVITNRATGRHIEVPGMAWHLIRDHHFFEGKRSPFHVDPALLVKVLYEE